MTTASPQKWRSASLSNFWNRMQHAQWNHGLQSDRIIATSGTIPGLGECSCLQMCSDVIRMTGCNFCTFFRKWSGKTLQEHLVWCWCQSQTFPENFCGVKAETVWFTLQMDFYSTWALKAPHSPTLYFLGFFYRSAFYLTFILRHIHRRATWG